ncbi:MAG: hypothetical protein ACJZ6C_01440 [Candidatus Poriferisodalaceae bacterium]
MRTFLHRFSTLYGPSSGLLSYHFVGLCALIFLLSLGTTAFGIAVALVAALVSSNFAGSSIFERIPASALLLLVACSGLFNDFRLSALILVGALVSTPLIAAIGERGSTSLLLQTARILGGWLPAGIAASSLITLALRDASSAGLLLLLIFFHDLGLKLCASGRPHHQFAPVVAISGSLALLWTSVQLSVSSISPNHYWVFACVLSVSILLGRLMMRLLVPRDGQRTSLLASHVVVAPLWTAAEVALNL